MSSINEMAIKVEGVSKGFKLPHEKQGSVKNMFVSLFHSKRTYERQRVLDSISFEIEKGGFFGIVGRNGSGKSTLLKLLAGIYSPDKGAITIDGKLTPFIELGVGFNPELTGRENVFLNGALLGFNRKEMSEMYEDIVKFAEIERFMDQKLKNYSSGMQVRLAFSIAIRAESEVLLFDEVLAVGDAAFQQKCYDMFDSMKKSGRTIVLVTHDMSAVQRFCDRAILLDKGKITMMGKPSEIADRYLEQNFERTSTKSESSDTPSAAFKVTNVALLADKKKTKVFDLMQDITLNFDVENMTDEKGFHIGIQIYNTAGAYCFGTNSRLSELDPVKSRRTNINCVLDQNLAPGTYFITLAVMNTRTTKVLTYLPKISTFNIKQETESQGVALLGTSWEVKDV